MNSTSTRAPSTSETTTGARPPQKKPERWMKFRHRVVRLLAYLVLYPYSRLRYGIRIEKHRDKRQYLILYNHQTPFDQFFVGMAFPRVIYYLATEDIFSLGFLSSLLCYLVAPIPIRKQTADLNAVRTLLRVAREGGSIAIAPEGNRTYSGRTGHMSPTIAPLARRMKLPIALYRIEGGYGIQPRWSDGVRKGRMRGYVSRVIEPEEYASLSDAELMDLIGTGLFVDEGVADGVFRSRNSAEYLERAIYVCPTCGLAKQESHGDTVTCTVCGRRVRYLPTKELCSDGGEFPFRFVSEWYDHQCAFVNGLDLTAPCERPYFEDVASLSEVLVYKKKRPIAKDLPVLLYGDRAVIGSETVLFSEATAFTVLGRNKLNVYTGGKVYQLKGDKRFCALKYVNFYHRYKNQTTGDGNGKFLGL